MQNIVERLQSEESALPHKQRRLAQYMLRNSGDMCYLTLRQLAERAGVSEVTVLRLCRALGLDGFNAMKEGFRLYQQALRESYRELADSAARRPIDPGDKTAMLLHCFETEMHNVGKFSKLFPRSNISPSPGALPKAVPSSSAAPKSPTRWRSFFSRSWPLWGCRSLRRPLTGRPSYRPFCPVSGPKTP